LDGLVRWLNVKLPHRHFLQHHVLVHLPHSRAARCQVSIMFSSIYLIVGLNVKLPHRRRYATPTLVQQQAKLPQTVDAYELATHGCPLFPYRV
jgi:hypothetical protein